MLGRKGRSPDRPQGQFALCCLTEFSWKLLEENPAMSFGQLNGHAFPGVYRVYFGKGDVYVLTIRREDAALPHVEIALGGG